MIKVLLIDPHALFQAGLKLLLTTLKSIEVIGEALSALEAYHKIKMHSPDLCIVDIEIFGTCIFEIVSKLKENCPSTHVVVLIGSHEESSIRTLLEAGVDGLIAKTANFDELEFAINVVITGHRFISPVIVEALIYYYLYRNKKKTFLALGNKFALSQQELKILQLFFQEVPPKAIAVELGISRKTVDIHKRNIKRKLGVNSDVGLVKLAMDIL